MIRILSGMGKSNRLEALETKIAFLLGEHEERRAEIAKAEQLVEALPAMRERLWEIETLVKACEAVVKSDHPTWTSDHIEPKHHFKHKKHVRLGMGIRQAFVVMRELDRPMTVRKIAIAVLKREEQPKPETATIDHVANAIGNGLRKGNRSQYVANDGEWPARWWVIKPN